MGGSNLGRRELLVAALFALLLWHTHVAAEDVKPLAETTVGMSGKLNGVVLPGTGVAGEAARRQEESRRSAGRTGLPARDRVPLRPRVLRPHTWHIRPPRLPPPQGRLAPGGHAADAGEGEPGPAHRGRSSRTSWRSRPGPRLGGYRTLLIVADRACGCAGLASP